MMLRGRQVQQIAYGGCDLPSSRILPVIRIGTSFFLVRLQLRRRLRTSHLPLSSLQLLWGRFIRQLFHVTRARRCAGPLPRANLPDEERRVLCHPATPPSTS